VDAVVQVQIVANDRPNAIVVPNASVQQDDRGRYVMVANRTDNTAHRRDVTVGVVSGPLTEILSGLAVGDEVVVRGAAELTDGAAISIER
jgi:multidrug efflux pump subunit AcrA (membrane-fusion protein)